MIEISNMIRDAGITPFPKGPAHGDHPCFIIFLLISPQHLPPLDTVFFGMEATSFYAWHLALYLNGAPELLPFHPQVFLFNQQLAAYTGMNTAINATGYALAQGLLARRMDAGACRAVLAVRLLDDWGYPGRD